MTVATRIRALDAEGRAVDAPVASIAPVLATVGPRASATVEGAATIANPRLAVVTIP